MKLKTFRYSGEPVRKEDRENYTREWTSFYDKATERAELNMEKLQRYLSFGEHCLIQKYNQPVSIELPKTARQWQKLIEQYEDIPFAVARTKDGKKVVLILMDQLSG